MAYSCDLPKMATLQCGSNGLSWLIMDYYGLLWTIMEYYKLNIMDYHGGV